jgi:Skp family chaperone for outer membrane proteins
LAKTTLSLEESIPMSEFVASNSEQLPTRSSRLPFLSKALTAPLLGAGLLMAGATGCSTQAPTAPVAVVDLDKVAELTGVSDDIKSKLVAREKSLNNELLTAQARLRQELNNRKAAAGEQPSNEETQKLQQFEATANRALVNARNTAKTLLDQERMKLVAQFRDQVKPIVAELAKEKGYSVVIPKNDGLLLAISPGVEITEAVAAAVGRGTITLGKNDTPAKAPPTAAPGLPVDHDLPAATETAAAPELPRE